MGPAIRSKQLVALAQCALVLSGALLPSQALAWGWHGQKQEQPVEQRHTIVSEPGLQSARAAPEPTAPQIAAAVKPSSLTLKGGVTFCVPSGTPFKLKLSTVPAGQMRLMNRDMDDKLPPAQLNQPITARLSEDIFVDDNKVIPEGTEFRGKVAHILPPRHVGRPGSLVLSFDQFVLPDGRKFAFSCTANNYRPSTFKSKMKGFGLILAHTAGGAATGALFAYQLCGAQQTVAMEGYNIAGGAAAGALMGTAVALWRKGEQAVLEPGEDLNMEIDTDLLLPAAQAPTVKKPPDNVPGLEIQALKSKVVKDGLGGHMLTVELYVDNRSNRWLKSIDLYLEDDNGNRFPVTTHPDSEQSDLIFTIDPHTQQTLRIAFQVEYPKLKRKVIWLDHTSRRALYECKVP